jgi:TRAP-type C4-dicarboxylate transport system substrate-binding protein
MSAAVNLPFRSPLGSSSGLHRNVAENPPDLRAALDEAGRALYRDGTEVMVGVHEGEYLTAVLEGGVELVEPSGAELEAFRAAVEPVYGRWEHLIGDRAVSDRAVALINEA